MCVSVNERESVSESVCVCVWKRERESAYMCVCDCDCLCLYTVFKPILLYLQRMATVCCTLSAWQFGASVTASWCCDDCWGWLCVWTKSAVSIVAGCVIDKSRSRSLLTDCWILVWRYELITHKVQYNTVAGLMEELLNLCWFNGRAFKSDVSVYIYVVCVSLSFIQDITDRRHLQSVALLHRLKAWNKGHNSNNMIASTSAQWYTSHNTTFLKWRNQQWQ